MDNLQGYLSIFLPSEPWRTDRARRIACLGRVTMAKNAESKSRNVPATRSPASFGPPKGPGDWIRLPSAASESSIAPASSYGLDTPGRTGDEMRATCAVHAIRFRRQDTGIDVLHLRSSPSRTCRHAGYAATAMRVAAYARCTPSPTYALHASNRAQSVTMGEKVSVSCFINAMTMRMTDTPARKPTSVCPGDRPQVVTPT